jgi:cysteine desulfurase
VASIVGLGKAAELMKAKLAAKGEEKVRAERDYFESSLMSQLSGVRINGHPTNRLTNTANLAFDDIEAAALLIMLDQEGICASAGSACHTGALHSSPVLAAMGFDRERALGTARFSLSSFTTREELDQAIKEIVQSVEKLRTMRSGSGVSVSS